MTGPQSERLAITPCSLKLFSITPASRVLPTPLSDDAIWKRLREAGFDEDSISRRDKAALIAYITKLETEIHDLQHHMGILLLEKKELASNYEDMKASAESAELLVKRQSASHLSTLAELRKREDNLKKTIGVKEECITSLEKTLHEMRAECAETKVSAECTLVEAHRAEREAHQKLTDANAKFNAAELLQAEANRFHSMAERKIQEVDAREDDLRRRITTFKSDCDEREKEIALERESLCERKKALQHEQESLLDAQSLLNQREEHIACRSRELNQFQKKIEDAKLDVENEQKALSEKKSNLELVESSLLRREEALVNKEIMLNKMEQDLLVLRETLATKGSEETQKVIAGQEDKLRKRKLQFEDELKMRQKMVEDEIETKRRLWELKEVDLKQHEDQLLDREHDLEVRSRAVLEREMDLQVNLSILEEKEKWLKAFEGEFEGNKTLLQREKEVINRQKRDLEISRDALASERRLVNDQMEKLKTMTCETEDLSMLEENLKKEIDLIRSQKLGLFADVDKLQAEKAEFEAKWELLEEETKKLQKEAEHVAKERLAISEFIENERENLRNEKEAMHQQYNLDVQSLNHERKQFMDKMVIERYEWLRQMQKEHDDLLRDIEMQKKEMHNLIEKRREEIETYLRDKEKLVEEEKKNELKRIEFLREDAMKQLEEVASEMKRVNAERKELSLDRERRSVEWVEISKCIEDLNMQREKLQKQRELLHADRQEVHAQTEELKKLENLKFVADNITMDKMLKSDIENSQQKAYGKRNLTPQLPKQNSSSNSSKGMYISLNGNGFNAPSVENVDGLTPPTTARLSWIKRYTKRIFRSSPEKSLLNYEKHDFRSSLEESKVILEVTPLHVDTRDINDQSSKTEEATVLTSAPSVPKQMDLTNKKRSNGNIGSEEVQNNKKMRQQLELSGRLQPSDERHDIVKDTAVVIVDKMVDISEERQRSTVPNEPEIDRMQISMLESDPIDFQHGTNGQSSSTYIA